MAWNRAEFLNVVNILNWTVLGDGAALRIVAYLSVSLIPPDLLLPDTGSPST